MYGSRALLTHFLGKSTLTRVQEPRLGISGLDLGATEASEQTSSAFLRNRGGVSRTGSFDQACGRGKVLDRCRERRDDQAVVGTSIPDVGRSDSAGGSHRLKIRRPPDRYWVGMRGGAAPQASGRREQHLLERCSGEPRATTHSPARSCRERPICATGSGPPPPSSTRRTARSDALRPKHAALHHHVQRTSAGSQQRCHRSVQWGSDQPQWGSDQPQWRSAEGKAKRAVASRSVESGGWCGSLRRCAGAAGVQQGCFAHSAAELRDGRHTYGLRTSGFGMPRKWYGPQAWQGAPMKPAPMNLKGEAGTGRRRTSRS